MAVRKRLNIVTVDDEADLVEFEPEFGLIIHIVNTQSTKQGNGTAFVPMTADSSQSSCEDLLAQSIALGGL
jgi:formylmethanofuran dehydrogenase subunit D